MKPAVLAMLVAAPIVCTLFVVWKTGGGEAGQQEADSEFPRHGEQILCQFVCDSRTGARGYAFFCLGGAIPDKQFWRWASTIEELSEVLEPRLEESDRIHTYSIGFFEEHLAFKSGFSDWIVCALSPWEADKLSSLLHHPVWIMPEANKSDSPSESKR